MSAVPEIVTKAEFASLLGVSRPAVSQYISEKKISGAALVGSGHRAKINIAIARRQLNKNLDVVRHNSLSGKARVTGPIADIDDLPVEHCDVGVEESIKQERLRQLELGNGKLQDEANARAGLYVLADDMRQELGIIVTRVLTEVDLLIVPSMSDDMLTIGNFVGVPSLTLRAGFIEVSEARSDWAPDPDHPLLKFDPPRRVPHGVTLIGRLFDEGTLARVGLALERSLNVIDERPPGF